MEFSFKLASFLGAPPDCAGPFVGIVDEAKLQGQRGRAICEVLEALGKASGAAQGLRKPVTTGTPHLPGQRIYLLASGRTALGFLKVGTKRLFVTPPPRSSGTRYAVVGDALREVNPLCALDFYVHESCQRSGYGRQLFDAMLRCEGLHAAQLAYDRPSPKLKGFLAKHYSLSRFRPQNNNYVIFDEYFDHRSGHVSEDARRGPASRSGALPATAEQADEPRPFHDSSRPPLPHQSSWASPSGMMHQAPDRDAGWQPETGADAHSGAAAPSLACERGRTPRAAGGINGSLPAGPGAAGVPPWGSDIQPAAPHAPCAAPAPGFSGRPPGPAAAAAGMPSARSQAGSQRARSTSAVGSSRSRVSSAGTDPGASWGRTGGSAASRFESPLSHAGRSVLMR
mmetsp:Transcript_2638/g.8157  ORF Transcript_2638/g.8157 Transcript_2638/m.8157 type:complete len:397 (+) Transcript_2638:80-1270(+)